MTHPISPAEAIFLALADLNPDERDAFLREHCGHDAQLTEVEAFDTEGHLAMGWASGCVDRIRPA